MSTYRKIHGRSIQAVTTDPTGDVAEGQVWYNTSSDTFKTVVSSKAWTSSAPLATGRANGGGSGNLQNSALFCGGYTTAGVANTEEYGGAGWTAGGNLNTGRYALKAAGTQTASRAFGGYMPPGYVAVTESYNGTAWTNGPSLNTARSNGSPAGTSTATLYAGGGNPSGVNNSEEYDGSSWSEGNNLNSGRSGVAGCGSQTAAIAMGGDDPGYVALTELYDGTSWTATSAMNTARGGSGGGGTQTSALVWGGHTGPGGPGAQAKTESWDGSSWTETADLSSTRNAVNGTGASNASAVCFGGDPQVKATEEFTSSANVITAGAWAAGGNLSTARTAIRGAGIQTAAWGVGGETGPGPTTNATENYDGTAWTGGGNFPANTRNSFTYGTQTAGLSAGGNSAPGQTPYNSASAEYDGSTWTASPGALSPAKGYGGSSGVQTSALATGGDGPPNPTSPFAQIGVQSYNGSTWSTETNYPINIYGATGAGVSETAAVVWGGTSPYPGTPNPNTSDYNGSAWTLVAKSIADVGASNERDVQGTNQAPSALCGSMGGNSGAVGFYQWNDTAWSTLPNMGTGGDRGGAGTLTAAIAFGGYHPGTPRLAATEEFTGETTALNVKTLTQS